MAKRPTILDGAAAVAALTDEIVEGVLPLVARTSVFLHPDTVRQAPGALFPVVRGKITERGRMGSTDAGRLVMFCDNASPRDAFLWAADRSWAAGNPVQFNHVWARSKDPDCYTALWNVFCSPKVFAGLTDAAGPVRDTVQFHAWNLYGQLPAGVDAPMEPPWYAGLQWAEHPPPVEDLANLLRSRLATRPKHRAAIAAREIGWLFA